MQRARLLLLSVLFLYASADAQTYNFRNYSDDDGLPQSYVYQITQSGNGFLNLSTGEGFCVFDGNKFITFNDKNGLAENFVTTHYSDSRHVLWLGHFQNGITYLYHKKFHQLKIPELSSIKINQFTETKDHRILVSTQGGGVWLIDTNFRAVRATDHDAVISGLCADRNGQLLYASTDGLYVSSLSGNKLNTLYSVAAFQDKMVKCITPADSSHSAFWVAVEGEGIYGIRLMHNRYVPWIHIGSQLGTKTGAVSSVYADRNGHLWVGLFGEGLRKITFSDRSLSDTSCTVVKIDKNNGLKNEYIQTIFEDFEGNMWFGTFGGGLIEKPIEKFSFYGVREGIAMPDIKSLIIDQKGHTWAGTTQGLVYFEPENMMSVVYNAKNGFTDDQVNTLMQDAQGKIWIGTAGSGVFVLDPYSRHFTSFSKANHLTSLSVNTICSNKKGMIYIGTDEGAYFYNPHTQDIKLMTTVEGLMHNNVRQLYIDSHDRLWFSSHGAPPYYLQDDNFTVYKHIADMKLFNVNAVCEDNNGNIWIATEGDGVYKFDGENFTNYRTDDGLLSNYCYGIRTDLSNTVWITHKTGLSEKKATHREFQNYTSREGLLFTENNLNAISRDGSGNLWFGTTQGIVHFNAINEGHDMAEPRLSILKVMLGKKLYGTDEPIVKEYGNYPLEVEYVGVSLSDPSKIRYKYRLLGVDSGWRSTTGRSIEYSNLPDGDYTFEVIACNQEGIWTSRPARVQIMIEKPVWKYPWFYLLLMGLIVAITYLIIYIRIRQLKKTEAFLQLKIRQKTYLLQREKETVEQIKIELEVKNKDIMDSINYARRIQEALLPSKRSIYEQFPGSFIYYQPRDIVSGDFYWYSETEEHYIMAVVDCTGHGVPGAFMSLIGSTLLNEIVNNNRITVPSIILQELNSRVIKTLNQSDDENPSYDGMDMAVCAISKNRHICVYAGAYRPLYLVRNNTLMEYKANRFSVGGHNTGIEKTFTDHIISLEPADMLYLFSDGFADQFNTIQKKFTTKRLKALLTGIAGNEGEAQLEIARKTFEGWKGHEEQVDDILLAGIRI